MKLAPGVRVKICSAWLEPRTKGPLFGEILKNDDGDWLVKWDFPAAVRADGWLPTEPFDPSILLVADNGLLWAIRKAKKE
jgi:hypothetical protein